jgi:hypothetical protein
MTEGQAALAAMYAIQAQAGRGGDVSIPEAARLSETSQTRSKSSDERSMDLNLIFITAMIPSSVQDKAGEMVAEFLNCGTNSRYNAEV